MLQSNKIITFFVCLFVFHMHPITNVREQVKAFTKGAASTTCAMVAGYVIGKQVDHEDAGAASAGVIMLTLGHYLHRNDPYAGIRTCGAVVPLIIAGRLFVNKVDAERIKQEKRIEKLDVLTQELLVFCKSSEERIRENNAILAERGIPLPRLADIQESSYPSVRSLWWLQDNSDNETFQLWRKEAFEACNGSTHGNFDDFCPQLNDDAIGVLSQHIYVWIQTPSGILATINTGAEKRSFMIMGEIAQKVLRCPTVRILSQERERDMQLHEQSRREHEQRMSVLQADLDEVGARARESSTIAQSPRAQDDSESSQAPVGHSTEQAMQRGVSLAQRIEELGHERELVDHGINQSIPELTRGDEEMQTPSESTLQQETNQLRDTIEVVRAQQETNRLRFSVLERNMNELQARMMQLVAENPHVFHQQGSLDGG